MTNKVDESVELALKTLDDLMREEIGGLQLEAAREVLKYSALTR